MKISEASRITGLTRKAIRYYEQQGLISPEIEAASSYREYSHTVVEQLAWIASLRNAGFSIADIREIIHCPAEARTVIERGLTHTMLLLNRMEQQKQLLENTLASSRNGEALLDVLVNEEHSLRSIHELAAERLSSLFPGAYGKLIAAHFSPFLEMRLLTEDQNVAWQSLVEYLDHVDEQALPTSLASLYESLNECDIEQIIAANRKRIMELTEMSDERLRQYANELSKQYRSALLQQTNGNGQTVHMAEVSDFKAMLASIGYYDVFITLMKRISPTYATYHRKWSQLIEFLENE